jgi:microcystin-dependent protein
MKITRKSALEVRHPHFFQFCCGALVLLAWQCASLPLMAQFTGTAGGGQHFPNLKPSLSVQYVICNQGVYPSRGDGTLASVDRSSPLLGEIRVVSFGSVPKGFLACNGQFLSLSQNTVLFSVIGITYGGNGTTTFGLPDLRGTVPIGAGQGPGLPNYAVGDRDGLETVALTTANLPAHTHSFTYGNTGSTGGSQAFDILQPSLALNFVIDENGEIMLFAGDYAPQGWAFCDGNLLQIGDHPGLFQYIGTNYGGDNVTTFALPDLRGRSPIGTGQLSGSGYYSLGQPVGAANTTLTSAQLPAHSHTIPGGNTGWTGANGFFDIRQPTLAMSWFLSAGGYLPTDGRSPILGELRLVAGDVSALGGQWLPATGNILPISLFYGLFSLIGTTYGGNGVNTFAPPDLGGRMALHIGTSPWSGASYTLGESLGSEQVILATNAMPVHAHTLPAPPTPPKLTGTKLLTNGAFQFAFTNSPGTTFTVLTSTNLSLPLSNWTVATTLTNFSPGQFQFTTQPTNEPNRYYRVRTP